MTNKQKNKIEENDIINEMETELEDLEDIENNLDIDNEDDAWDSNSSQEDEKCKDILARTMADFENFKKRVDRDREDMIFFLKQDIFKKILPRLDDIQRIIKNTPEEIKIHTIYEWITSIESKFKKDLESMWVKEIESIWKEVDPNIHDVMTTVPWKEANVIFDEFEKWYIIWDKVLRPAKVVVWA